MDDDSLPIAEVGRLVGRGASCSDQRSDEMHGVLVGMTLIAVVMAPCIAALTVWLHE
jgi:hypothetical protein